jgi:hypothetical protein
MLNYDVSYLHFLSVPACLCFRDVEASLPKNTTFGLCNVWVILIRNVKYYFFCVGVCTQVNMMFVMLL